MGYNWLLSSFCSLKFPRFGHWKPLYVEFWVFATFPNVFIAQTAYMYCEGFLGKKKKNPQNLDILGLFFLLLTDDLILSHNSRILFCVSALPFFFLLMFHLDNDLYFTLADYFLSCASLPMSPTRVLFKSAITNFSFEDSSRNGYFL